MNTEDLVKVECPSGLVVWMRRLTPAEILMAGIALWNPLYKPLPKLEKPRHLSDEKWAAHLKKIQPESDPEEVAQYTEKVFAALEKFSSHAELPNGQKLIFVREFRMPEDDLVFFPVGQLEPADFAVLHDYLIGKYGRDEKKIRVWLRSDTAKAYASLARYWGRFPSDMLGLTDDPIFALIVNTALATRLAEE